MAEKYRKKPVVIEAVRWDGTNKVEIQHFMNRYLDENTITHGLIIPTLEGDHIASVGDYIIKGVHGEFYPCKPDIFAKTYEDATIDPASLRPKGEWVQVICHVEFEDGFADRLYECCSRCHEPNGRRLGNFCPNCGADMRGDNDG